VVLHQVVVGSGAIVAAGAVLTPRSLVPPGAMARGVPAQIVEVDEATRDQRIQRHHLVSEHYWQNAQRWMRDLRPVE
jgi:carbonic anhydrase/acetyltransferase-like protein (isoleucine patch superfamily)